MRRIVIPEDDMAAGLMVDGITDFAQDGTKLLSRKNR